MLHSTRRTSLKNSAFDHIFESDEAKNLWITISQSLDCFSTPENPGIFSPHHSVDKYGENSANWLWQLDAGRSWPKHYMPIRCFRQPPPPFMAKKEATLSFLSSGTTSGPDGRSKSPFTRDGAALYRSTSLLTFAEMLNKISGHDRFAGVSLVPQISLWPESSLARMIHWISEFWPLSYADYLNRSSVEAAIEKHASDGSTPVFIFGTAFHLIDFLDQNEGKPLTLPPGSLVIETGGTKGRTRSVTRPELYGLISRGFGISENQIVSEYGMCELASQAYDFVPQGEAVDLSRRRFRFPWWAPVAVMKDPTTAQQEGEGALIVWDTARIDVPAPIQIEDLVHLEKDGTFQLLGRVPTAPLKGCSLKVDEIVEDVAGFETPRPNETSTVTAKKLNLKVMARRAEQVVKWLHSLASDSVFAMRLTQELGSKTIAVQAIEDLKTQLPHDANAMLAAALTALEGQNEIAAAWLVIPPSTHSLAALQSIALLLCCDVQVRIRLSAIVGQSPDGSSLNRAFELLTISGFNMLSAGPNWKIKTNADLRDEAILMFGDDSTIDHIKHVAKCPVAGFGNALAATLTRATDLQDETVRDQLVRDNIALAQRGCMSARVNFVVGSSIDRALREKLLKSFEEALSDRELVPLPRQVAQSLEIVRLRQSGAEVLRCKDSRGLLAFFSDHDGLDLADSISRQEFNFIFLLCNDDDLSRCNWGSKISQFKKISITTSVNALFTTHSALIRHMPDLVPIGSLNSPSWNGRHLNLPILSKINYL